MEDLLKLLPVWNTYPTHSFYKTSFELSLKPKKSVFVYVIHSTIPTRLKEVEINSLCFKLYSVHVESLEEPLGYIIVPKLLPKYILRNSQNAVVATSPDATVSSVRESELKVVYKNDNFSFLWRSSDTEIFTDLGVRMGVAFC